MSSKTDKNDKKEKKEKKKYKQQDGEEGDETVEREIKMKLTKKETSLRAPVHYVSERTEVSTSDQSKRMRNNMDSGEDGDRVNP